MYALLKSYIDQRHPISEADWAYVQSKFKTLTATRNQHLLEPGQHCDHYYFVNKGCIRLYALNTQGQEGTRYFAFEGAFGTALPSFIEKTPAFEYIQAIEPSELLVSGRDDFYDLVDKVPAFGYIYRRILELSFITAQRRIYGFQNMDAEQKVRWVLAYQPGIMARISNKMLASYLGLTPATLSRIKRKL